MDAEVAQRPSSGEQEWVQAPACTSCFHLRSGYGCGGRRHPGWPHPGDRSRSDTCHSHTAVVRRQRCWPGTEPSRQNHNHVHSVWSCSSSTSQRDTAACSLRVVTSSATIWASPSPAPPQSVCDIFCEPILHSKTYKSVRQKQLIAKCCQKSGT